MYIQGQQSTDPGAILKRTKPDDAANSPDLKCLTCRQYITGNGFRVQDFVTAGLQAPLNPNDKTQNLRSRILTQTYRAGFSSEAQSPETLYTPPTL